MKAYRVTHSRSYRTVGDLCGSQSAFRAAGLSRARSVSDANVCGTRRPERSLCRTSRRLLRLDCINLVQGCRSGGVTRSLVPIPLIFLAAALPGRAENRFLPRHRAYKKLRRDGRRSAIRGDEADWQPERRRPQGLRRSLKSRSSSISG